MKLGTGPYSFRLGDTKDEGYMVEGVIVTCKDCKNCTQARTVENLGLCKEHKDENGYCTVVDMDKKACEQFQELVNLRYMMI